MRQESGQGLRLAQSTWAKENFVMQHALSDPQLNNLLILQYCCENQLGTILAQPLIEHDETLTHLARLEGDRVFDEPSA